MLRLRRIASAMVFFWLAVLPSGPARGDEVQPPGTPIPREITCEELFSSEGGILFGPTGTGGAGGAGSGEASPCTFPDKLVDRVETEGGGRGAGVAVLGARPGLGRGRRREGPWRESHRQYTGAPHTGAPAPARWQEPTPQLAGRAVAAARRCGTMFEAPAMQ
jgi:hypothetical protein